MRGLRKLARVPAELPGQERKAAAIAKIESMPPEFDPAARPGASYLATVPPDKLLGLLGEQDQGKLLQDFLRPLGELVTRQDLTDSISLIITSGLGLGITIDKGKVDAVALRWDSENGYPGRLPFDLKLPVKGSYFLERFGAPNATSRLGVGFRLEEYIIRVYCSKANCHKDARLRKDHITEISVERADGNKSVTSRSSPQTGQNRNQSAR